MVCAWAVVVVVVLTATEVVLDEVSVPLPPGTAEVLAAEAPLVVVLHPTIGATQVVVDGQLQSSGHCPGT